MKPFVSRYFKNTITWTISIFLLLFATTKANAQTHQEIDDIIKITPEKYDFGEVKQTCDSGNAVYTYFEITNISDKPVVIDIQSGWSCLMPVLEKNDPTIAPNKTYKLKVRFIPCINLGVFMKGVYINISGIEKQVHGKTVAETEQKHIYFTGRFVK